MCICIVTKQTDLLLWTQILGVPEIRTFVSPRFILRNLLNWPFHLDNPPAGLCRWPRCRCCPQTWILSRPQSRPAVRTERWTSTNKSIFILLCYVMIYKVLHVILNCNVWPVATIVGFDHCNCLIPILLWHLCI